MARAARSSFSANSGSLSGLTASCCGRQRRSHVAGRRARVHLSRKPPRAWRGRRRRRRDLHVFGARKRERQRRHSRIGPPWRTIAYGATIGTASGIVSSGLSITETPGTQSGAYCAGADLAVTNSGSAESGRCRKQHYLHADRDEQRPAGRAQRHFRRSRSRRIPHFNRWSSAPGWSCATPAVGSAGNINCTNPDVADAAIGHNVHGGCASDSRHRQRHANCWTPSRSPPAPTIRTLRIIPRRVLTLVGAANQRQSRRHQFSFAQSGAGGQQHHLHDRRDE